MHIRVQKSIDKVGAAFVNYVSKRIRVRLLEHLDPFAKIRTEFVGLFKTTDEK